MLRYLIVIALLVGCNEQNFKMLKDDLQTSSPEFGNNASGEIVIDLDKNTVDHTIDRTFYGTQLSPFTKLPPNSVTNPLELGTIRIGGNLYDTYNWENNLTYLGGRHYVQLDSYKDLIEKVRSYGAEPIMQVNLMGWRPVRMHRRTRMANTADASSAAQFIKKANGIQGLGIKHVCLGNEFAQWIDTHPDIWPGTEPLSADEYIDRFISFSLAIRKAQEEVSGNPNDIKIWGPEISISHYDWQSSNMRTDCEWTDIRGVIRCSYGNGEFDHFMPYFFHRLREAEKDTRINPDGYKLLDYASFHYYPNFRNNINDPDSIIRDAQGYQMVHQMLESTQLLHDGNYINRYDRASYRNFRPNIFGRMKTWMSDNYPDAKLALSEFAVDSYDTTMNYHPIVRPLYMADAIGIATQNGIVNFNRSFLNSYGPEPIPWALLLDDRPTNLAKVYTLLSRNFHGKVVSINDTFGDRVNAYAVLTNDVPEEENVTLFIVNKNADPVAATIMLKDDGKKIGGISKTLAPWSVTLIKAPRNDFYEETAKFLVEGADSLGIEIDPHYNSK